MENGSCHGVPAQETVATGYPGEISPGQLPVGVFEEAVPQRIKDDLNQDYS